MQHPQTPAQCIDRNPVFRKDLLQKLDDLLAGIDLVLPFGIQVVQ